MSESSGGVESLWDEITKIEIEKDTETQQSRLMNEDVGRGECVIQSLMCLRSLDDFN